MFSLLMPADLREIRTVFLCVSPTSAPTLAHTKQKYSPLAQKILDNFINKKMLQS